MTIPSRVNDEWRTIVVPQTVAAGTTLFSITIGGVPYKFTKNEAFTYVSGKMMNFGIKVDKQTGSGAYKLTLVSESITPWENDLVSHDATAKEYIVINSTPGGLKNAITAANKDYTKLKNLKITGEPPASLPLVSLRTDDGHKLHLMRPSLVDRVPDSNYLLPYGNQKSSSGLYRPTTS